MIGNDSVALFSLLNLGIVGGLSHCSLMCAPIVMGQVTNRISKLPVEEFYGLTRLKSFLLLPYHLGRITTYAVIGAICSYLGSSIQNFSPYRFIAAAFLILAALVFFSIALGDVFTRLSKMIPDLIHRFFTVLSKFPINLFRRIFARGLFSECAARLSKNPTGLRGYALGLLLGFIPCGLLYSAFALSSTISNPGMAFIGMLMFGAGTMPSLFLTAYGGYTLLRFAGARMIMKISSALNAALLLIMAILVITG